jgi:penicillin-binding protein 2
LAGLETGAINADTSVLDEGILRVGDYEYRNWYYTQYGRTEGEISLVRALARSNDIYFYKVAEWTGPDKLAEFSQLLGLGKKTGIELNAEAAGLIPTPSWKEKTLGEPWYLGNTFHMGIGQGNILTSPIQIAQLTQAVANDGELCSARLINLSQPTESSSAESIEQEQNCAQLSLNPDNLALVMNGLLGACSPGGTAYPFFTHNQQMLNNQEGLSYEEQFEAGAVACKTGTAEFGAVDEQGHRKTHGWFTLILDTEQIQALAAELDSVEETTSETETLPQPIQFTTQLPEESEETQAAVSEKFNHTSWLKSIQQQALPEKLVITVLVESDEQEPFKEGSEHAAEVAKAIVDWMYGR